MDRGLALRLAELYEKGEAAVLCTVVGRKGSAPRSSGAAMLVFPGGRLEGSIGGGITEHRIAEKALALLERGGGTCLCREILSSREGASEGAACGGAMEVFLEVVGKMRHVTVFGAGHVGAAVARIANWTGFSVTVWDEREEFANGARIPWGKVVCCPLEEFFRAEEEFPCGAYAVVATRGHALDGDVVRLLEGKKLAYLGMIGSRRKMALLRQRLLGEGVSGKHLDSVYQPIGMPIGAETPEEIAVSVMAEIIAVDRGADVASLRRSYSS